MSDFVDSSRKKDGAHGSNHEGHPGAEDVINASGGMFEDHGQDEVDLTHDDQVAGKGSSSVAPGGGS